MDVGLFFIRVSLMRKPRPRKMKPLFGAKNAWPTLIRAQVNLAPDEEQWEGFLEQPGLAAGRRWLSCVPNASFLGVFVPFSLQ